MSVKCNKPWAVGYLGGGIIIGTLVSLNLKNSLITLAATGLSSLYFEKMRRKISKKEQFIKNHYKMAVACGISVVSTGITFTLIMKMLIRNVRNNRKKKQ